mgnify:CR=1 FL=1
MTTLLITHPCFVLHDTGPGHPERPDRLRALDRLFAHEVFAPLQREEAPLRADVEEAIVLAHPQRYLDYVKNARPGEDEEPVRLDPDTVLSPGSWEPALRAVGAGLLAVDRVMDKASGIKNAFAQVRPCGHHAEAERAMGFCFFNNVAVGAAHALDHHGLERVAVLDFDVHLGNGTEDIFRNDPRVLLCSSYQYPLYPDMNPPSVPGHIVNCPLPPGSGSEAFRAAVTDHWVPALDAFRPQLVFISAGFDAHANDPLAELSLGTRDYTWVTGVACDVAERHCGGRVVSTLEGGYDLTALATSAAAHIERLMHS